MPNFMKIQRGQDFFVNLVWNDPNCINHTLVCSAVKLLSNLI